MASTRIPQTINQNGGTSGFEMCFAIGSHYLGCRFPTVPTVPTKTRFEFRFWNKKCKPHFLYTIGVHFRYRIKNKIDSEVESRAKKYRAAEEKRVNNGRSRYWCESQDPPVRFEPGKYTCNADSSYTLREQVCGGSVFILATSLLCAYLTVILSCVFCCFQLN